MAVGGVSGQSPAVLDLKVASAFAAVVRLGLAVALAVRRVVWPADSALPR